MIREKLKLLISPTFSQFDHLREQENQQPKEDQLLLKNQCRKCTKVIKESKGIAQVYFQWQSQKIRRSNGLQY